MPPPRFLPSSFVKTAWQAHSAAVAWPLAEWKASGQFCLFLQHSNTLLLCALVAVCRWLWQHALQQRHGHWPSAKPLAPTRYGCVGCVSECGLRGAGNWIWHAGMSSGCVGCVSECGLRGTGNGVWHAGMSSGCLHWMRFKSAFQIWPQRDRQWDMTCWLKQCLPALDAFLNVA